jgi:hypothetical protein
MSEQRADHTLLLLLQAPCSLNPNGQGCNGGDELSQMNCRSGPPQGKFAERLAAFEAAKQRQAANM